MTFCIFPLSRTNFSVPFRPPLKQQCGAKWICNLFKQLSLPFWESTFYPPPPSRKCHSQMYKCSQYKQMLVKFVIMQWNECEWGADELPKLGHISVEKLGNQVADAFIPDVGVTMVEASPLMPGLVPEWAIVGRPVICCGARCYWRHHIFKNFLVLKYFFDVLSNSAPFYCKFVLIQVKSKNVFE